MIRRRWYLVVYDIHRCPRRLVKVARCLEQYGMRLQYSVFLARLSAAQRDELWARLLEIADPDQDELRLCPLDGRRAVYYLGVEPLPEDVMLDETPVMVRLDGAAAREKGE